MAALPVSVGSGSSCLAQETQGQVDSEHIVRSVQVAERKLVKGITEAPDRQGGLCRADCVSNSK